MLYFVNKPEKEMKRRMREPFRKICLFAIAIFACLFCFPNIQSFGANNVVNLENIKGPKIKDLYMVIYRDPDSQILALETGKLDVLGDIIRPVDIKRLSSRDDILMTLSEGFHIFFLGFNLREFPWNDLALRKALSHAVPRKKFVRDLFAGYCLPIYTYLPPVSPYYEPDVTHYEYDPEKAKKILAEAEWKWSQEGLLIPPGSDKPLEKVSLLCPTAQAAPTTAELASRIAESFASLGLPVELEMLDFSMMIKRLDKHDFDLFVMAWSLSRDPDNLFAFFHSSMDTEGGYNIQGLHDSEIDKVLEDLRWAPDKDSAVKAAKEAQEMLSDKAPWIPIYSRYMISAIRKDWKGLTFSKKTTADNIWSLLNMEPVNGKMRPLYWCLPEDPRTLNPLAAGSAYDWAVLGLIYESLIGTDPYTLDDIPQLALKWNIETETHGTKKLTKLVFHLREDVTWQDGAPFTSEDVKETILFLKKHQLPRYFDQVNNVVSVETPNEHEVVVTLENTSYWYLHNIGGLPIFPAHILKNVENWKSWRPERQENPKDPKLTQLVGTGPFIFMEYKPGEYVHLKRYDGYWKNR